MGNTITQLPGELNLDMVDDNDLIFSIDWNTDLSGYSFTANIIPKNCTYEIPMYVDVISASAGTMNIIISASSIADISPSTGNRWYLDWTTPTPESYIRTVLAGTLILRSR